MEEEWKKGGLGRMRCDLPLCEVLAEMGGGKCVIHDVPCIALCSKYRQYVAQKTL